MDLNKLVKKFEIEVIGLNNKLIATNYFNRIINSLGESNFIDANFSLNNDSIFFWFSDSIKEFKLEVFFDYDSNDEDDIESVLLLYKSSENVKNHCGSLEYILNLYKTI